MHQRARTLGDDEAGPLPHEQVNAGTTMQIASRRPRPQGAHMRENTKFASQRGRALVRLVRRWMWLAVSQPASTTCSASRSSALQDLIPIRSTSCRPMLGIILLSNGMQSSLSMCMTARWGDAPPAHAPLRAGLLLVCKLVPAPRCVITCYVFLASASCSTCVRADRLADLLPALTVSGLMRARCGCSVGAHQAAGTRRCHELRDVPDVLLLLALFPLWKLREGGSRALYWVLAGEPFTLRSTESRFCAPNGGVRDGGRAWWRLERSCYSCWPWRATTRSAGLYDGRSQPA